MAGAKNPGAWHRFNKWLFTGGADGIPQGSGVTDALKAALLASDNIDNYFNALDGIRADAGFEGFPNDVASLVDAWIANGIPLQVWMGRLSWTEYDRTGVAGAYIYTPRGQGQAHLFGKDVRRICRHFQFSTRELSDLANLGENNPGKNPDANPDS